MNQFLNNVKDTLKAQSGLLLKPFGLDLLSTAQSETLLADYRIYNNPAQTLTLNSVTDMIDSDKVLFEAKEIATAPAYVWQYPVERHPVERHPVESRKARLLRNGSIQLGTNVLNPDFGNGALVKDMLKFAPRKPLQADTLIAPWSHYWAGGYFDYLIFVVLKLYRIKRVLPAADFANAVVAYPLLNTPFERDLLTLLGCRPDQVVDSRTTDIRFSRCVLGNSGSWFYPNVADLLAFKEYVAMQMPPTQESPKRLYISRTGRRRVIGEDALVRLLQTYGFTYVEDKPRSVVEQYQLYNNARFIIGPHGASYANILWCEPGTHLFELFPDDYMPEYYRYMAQVLGMGYSAYCQGDGSAARSHYSNLHKDVPVSIEDLERRLNRILETDVAR